MKIFWTILIIVIIILIISWVYSTQIKAKTNVDANEFQQYEDKVPSDISNSITTLIADGIEGTKPNNPDIFAIYFKGANRPPKGETYKSLNKVRIRGAGLFDGTYNTRPGWFFIDSDGNLGNIIVEAKKYGDYKGKVEVDLL